MHDGCSGNFTNGEAVVNKLRMMGFQKDHYLFHSKLNVNVVIHS